MRVVRVSNRLLASQLKEQAAEKEEEESPRREKRKSARLSTGQRSVRRSVGLKNTTNEEDGEFSVDYVK